MNCHGVIGNEFCTVGGDEGCGHAHVLDTHESTSWSPLCRFFHDLVEAVDAGRGPGSRRKGARFIFEDLRRIENKPGTFSRKRSACIRVHPWLLL